MVQLVELDELEELSIATTFKHFNLVTFDEIKLQATNETYVNAISSVLASTFYTDEYTVIDRDPFGVRTEALAAELVEISLQTFELIVKIHALT